MNKKLIALAVAGACVPPAAMAQTANPVTLFGRVYVMVESIEAKGGASPLVRRNRVEDRVSELGVRGTEDLGGGLKAFFQLDTAFRPDDSAATTFATRNSGVGLQGGFGSILLGRWDSPMKMSMTAVDPFGDNALGDVTAATLRSPGAAFSQRLPNVIQYWSPKFGGVELKAAYSANELKTAAVNPYQMGASVVYSQGPIYAALAWEEHKDSVGITATQGVKEEGFAGAVRVAFGPARISGQYGEYKRTSATKNKGYLVGLDLTFGRNVFLASFQNSKNGGLTTAATQPECDVWSVGYRYDFTRRTSLIADYTEIDNNSASQCNFGQGTIPGIANGHDPKGFGVGIRHTF